MRRGVPARRFNCQPVVFHSNECVHQVGKLDAEKSNTAVDISKVSGSAVLNKFARHVDQSWQKPEVVLKKRIPWHFPAIGSHPQNHFQTAFGRWIGPDLCDLFVEGWLGDLAPLEVFDQAIGRPDKTDVESLFEFIPLAPNHDSVSVSVWLRSGDHFGGRPGVQAADSFVQISNLLVVESQVSRAIEVPGLAASAFAE